MADLTYPFRVSASVLLSCLAIALAACDIYYPENVIVETLGVSAVSLFGLSQVLLWGALLLLWLKKNTRAQIKNDKALRWVAVSMLAVLAFLWCYLDWLNFSAKMEKQHAMEQGRLEKSR